MKPFAINKRTLSEGDSVMHRGRWWSTPVAGKSFAEIMASLPRPAFTLRIYTPDPAAPRATFAQVAFMLAWQQWGRLLRATGVDRRQPLAVDVPRRR